MEASHPHACPSCSAPAQRSQRWCLECGTELQQSRRGGLRPAVGIATTLAVLVGAASAGGYSLLASDRQPPPPPLTVASAPPPATTPAPATQEPSTSTYDSTPTYPLPSYSSSTTGSNYGGSTYTTSTTPNGGAGDGGTGGGAHTGGTGTGAGTAGQNGGGTTTTPPPPPRNVITNVALGAVAVVYAPYTPGDVDLGDASRVADDSTKTVWKTPAVADPTVAPQAGVYIDLASRETIRRLVLKTPTPGMSFEVYGAVKGPPAQITDAGWDHIATHADARARTSIDMPDTAYRYVLVWVTGLPPDATRAAISELALLSLQPE
ncbi:MAG TPA: hypothetical protein VE972_04750 [Conexibacter sp.]|nr:hypothetical protein [Conexibacter sp.]